MMSDTLGGGRPEVRREADAGRPITRVAGLAGLVLALCSGTATAVAGSSAAALAQTTAAAAAQSTAADGTPTAAGGPVVHAVLFYSSACPHCQDLVYVDLPPIQKVFGSSLDIAYLRTGDPTASLLYDIAVTRFGIAHTGVPMMVIGDRVLMGRAEVRDTLPLLVQGYMERGGLGWPDIPGLEYAVAGARATPAPEALAGAGAAAAAATPATRAPTVTPSATPTARPTVVPSRTITPAPRPTPTPTPGSGPLGACPASGALVLLAIGALAVRQRIVA